jgi:hypothetical protein
MTASDMGSVYSRVIAVLLVLLALAACGGGDDEPAAEQPEKTGESGGLATYEVASFGFSIGVPSDWTALSADEALDDEVLDAIRENDPELAPIVDQIGREDSPIKLFALAPEPDDGFTTNLNVVVIEDVPEGTTREDYFAASTNQIEDLGATGAEEERTDLPAGEALVLRYEHRLGGAAQPLAALQYVLLENGIGYTLTYTALASAAERHTADFERSAQSFRIG